MPRSHNAANFSTNRRPCPLSPSGGFVLQSLVFKFSPTHAHTRAGKPKNTQRSTPRPIELQRTAAQLIAHIPALKTIKHVGQICDILANADIDTTRWTGRDIARELTTDTQTRGRVWPTHLTRPTMFLRWRLAHIDWTAPSPAERARDNDRTRLAEQAARRRETRERDSHVAHARTRTEIMQHLREQLETKPQHRRHRHESCAAADGSHPPTITPYNGRRY